jgi:hypothetical protein
MHIKFCPKNLKEKDHFGRQRQRLEDSINIDQKEIRWESVN